MDTPQAARRREVRHMSKKSNWMAWLGVMLAPASPSFADATHGKTIYLARCAACHGRDLRGNGPLG